MKYDINHIRKFVGNIQLSDMKNIDSFLSENVAVFIPSVGPCYYAISENHSHPSYSFILSFDNFTKILINGEKITSQPGKFAAFSPDVVHHEILTEEFSRYIAIMILKDYFENEFREYTAKKMDIFKCVFFDSSLELRNYIKDFVIEYNNKLPGYQKMIKSIELNITHAIIRSILNIVSAKEEISSRIDITNIIEYMHSNYDKKLSIEDLSNEISLSPSHFSRIFKREVGRSPLDYLIQIRLEKAKKLLMLGEKSITEIALDTGFNSSSHFSSCFLKYYKITPSEYKKIV